MITDQAGKKGRIKGPDPTSTYEKRPLGGQTALRSKTTGGFNFTIF